MKLHKHCTLDTSTVAKQNRWEMRNGNYPYIHKYTCHYLHLHTGVCESLHHPKRWKLLDFICVLVDAKRLGRGKSASLESTSQCWGRTRASCLQLHTSWAKVPLWVWRSEMPCLYPFQKHVMTWLCSFQNPGRLTERPAAKLKTRNYLSPKSHSKNIFLYICSCTKLALSLSASWTALDLDLGQEPS